MVKKIRLLGMEIDNFSLREEVLLSEAFYDYSEMNVIRTISMQMFGLAAEDKQVRDGILQADLIIVDDKEILTESGIYSSQRIREADEHWFIQEFLKRAARNKKRVFLVAEQQIDLENVTKFLHTAYEKMQIAGNYVIANCNGAYDGIVNEINACAPDVILSVLDAPFEDQFLAEMKVRIDARIWYSVGVYDRRPSGRLPILMRLKQMIHIGRFRAVLHEYEDENE